MSTPVADPVQQEQVGESGNEEMGSRREAVNDEDEEEEYTDGSSSDTDAAQGLGPSSGTGSGTFASGPRQMQGARFGGRGFGSRGMAPSRYNAPRFPEGGQVLGSATTTAGAEVSGGVEPGGGAAPCNVLPQGNAEQQTDA